MTFFWLSYMCCVVVNLAVLPPIFSGVGRKMPLYVGFASITPFLAQSLSAFLLLMFLIIWLLTVYTFSKEKHHGK